MIQENIKINYEEICNEYIKPYLDSIGMNFTESYLGLSINENVYLSGWDGNGKSVIIPMKYSDNGFIIVDTLSPDYNPIHFREFIEESDVIEDGNCMIQIQRLIFQIIRKWLWIHYGRIILSIMGQLKN